MTELGHGLQIVSVEGSSNSHEYRLEERDLEELLLHEDVKDLPVVVVSVAGAYRGGKSFLLNFFLRYLSSPQSDRDDGTWLGENSEPLAGFQWRSGIRATTMGILMWSEPFVNTLPSGERVAVLLVDTQGTFDSKSTVRDNTTIFALSTLVSSVQIYNLSGNIKEDDLQHLELFTEYGKMVNAGDPKKKAFQVLEFLVRDWCCADDSENGYPYGTDGGERLLQEKLEITADQADEMKNLRLHIRSSFEKVTCFLMPHPGFKVLKPKFQGNISDIDPEFRTQLKDLVNSIFSQEKLLPKTINGEKIKARDLFNYFKTYMELFNSDKIPSPGNIMAMTVKAGLLSAVSEAHDIYEKGMDAECGPKQLFLPAVDLKFLHDKYVKLAIESYINKKKLGTEKEIAEYLDKLTKELGDRLPQFLQSNLSKIQDAISKAKDVYDKEIQNISKDKLLICLHPLDLDNVHKAAVDTAIKSYDAAQKQRVSQEKNDERAKFIRGFEKEYNLLRQLNKQNNNRVVSELLGEYLAKMQPKALLDPPLTDVEFKKEHKDAKNKALSDFDLKRNMPNHYIEDSYKLDLAKSIQDSFTQLKKINKSKNGAAMQAGIDEYDNYINEHWDKATQCLHPDDLVELNRLSVCRALEVFHPRKQCADGFDETDEDEATMKTTLDDRYERLQRNNDDTNETAVLLAYDEYVKQIDYNCGFSIWWLAIVPYFVNRSRRDSYHEDSKNKALEVFYGQRRNSEKRTSDPYRERLNEKMEEYFRENYKV